MNKILNIRKTILTVVVINLLQIAIVAGFVVYEVILHRELIVTGQFKDLNLLFGIVLAIIFINSFLILRDAYILNQVRFQDEMVKETLARVEDLNKTLRGQRHDFMNHLQVVYSLIELNEYQEAQSYLDRVYSDIQKVARVLKTVNPAINALLQAKILDCEKRGIKTRLDIRSQLRDLPIPTWEMCRILGNLIDNAIDALEETKRDCLLAIELYEDLKFYGFRVKNNGPAIPRNLWEKIFEVGFTTKGDQGEGMGLAIVKEIMESYQGEITLDSNEEMTVFQGQVPKRIK